MKIKILYLVMIVVFGARTGLGITVKADQFPGEDGGAKISAAIAAAGDFGIVDAREMRSPQTSASDLIINKRVQLYLPCGSLTFASDKGIRIKATGVALIGCGPTSTVLISSGTTGNFISNPDAPSSTYSLSRIENLDIQTSSPRTSGALLNATNLDQGLVQNVRILGNWFDVFDHLGHGSGSWRYDRVVFPGGQTVNRIWWVQSSSGTSSGLQIFDTTVFDSTTYNAGGAGLDLDTGTDGTRVIGSDVGLIHIHNSLSGAMPQYIRCVECLNEGRSQTYNNVTIDDGKDITIEDSYFGSGQNGFVITGGQDIKISHNHIVSMKFSALSLTGGTRVQFDGNTITDTSQAASKAHDSITVGAGVSDWYVRNNTFRHTSGYTSIPRRQISVAAGPSNRYEISGNDYGVSGRDFGASGDAAVMDLGTGNSVVRGNDLPAFLVRGTGPITHNGTGSETAVLSWTLPGGTLGPGNGLHFVLGGSTVGSGGNHTITLYFGSTQVGQVTVGSGAESWAIEAWVFNSSTVTNQEFTSVATHGTTNKDGATVRTYSSGMAQNTATDVPLRVTCSATAGDQIIVRTFYVDTLRK
jgi:hypothetical protein